MDPKRPRPIRSFSARSFAFGLSMLAVGAAVALAGCGTSSVGETAEERARRTGFRGVTLPEPVEKLDFTLRATDGRPFDFRAETDGLLTLLFFGYTSCPDACPVHMANLAAVLGDLSPELRARIRVVFVTTDPERDTPARLRAWLDEFDRRFVGLRGPRERLDSIMARLGLARAVRQQTEDGDYLVGHASQVIAFTPDDSARVVYPFGTRQRDWAHDLPRLATVGSPIELSRARIEPGLAGDGARLYVTISNRGDRPDELIGATTPAARRMEMRRGADPERASSVRASGIVVPAGRSTPLRPGAEHVALAGLTHALQPGDTVRVELRFRNAGRVPARAVVRTAGAPRVDP